MVIDFGLRAAKWVAVSSIISPAPISSSRWSEIAGKIRSASLTAAAAIEIEALPMSVCVRTSFATANVRWNSRLRTSPRLPADSAWRTACFICPRICGSPSTIESRPLATRNAWVTALLARQRVDVRRQRILRHAMEVLEPAHDGLRLAAVNVDLGPVARRQDRGFLDPGPARRSRSAWPSASGENTTCSRTASGAVWWLRPRV